LLVISMDEIFETPRAFSPVGFVMSLLVIFLWSGVFFALGVGLIFAGVAALFGFDHAAASVRLVMGASAAGGTATATREVLVFLLGCLVYLSLMGGLYVMARLREGARWRLALGWVPGRAGRLFWGLILLGWAYGVGASLALSQLPSGVRSGFTMPAEPLAAFLSFLLVVVLAPIAEELLFRGWVFTGLRRFGFQVALWGSAVLFALAHWGGTIFYSLAILPIGLILGVLRERSGSVRTTSAFHAFYNFLMWGLTFLGKV
jgi:membrane protease YdiL (CAAX protease family)